MPRERIEDVDSRRSAERVEGEVCVEEEMSRREGGVRSLREVRALITWWMLLVGKYEGLKGRGCYHREA